MSINFDNCFKDAQKITNKLKNTNYKDLEKSQKSVINMSSRSIGGNYSSQSDDSDDSPPAPPSRDSSRSSSRKRTTRDNSSSDECADSDGEETRPPPLILRPVGILSEEYEMIERERFLRDKFNRDRDWTCKYCNLGDGKIDGLSPFNMRVVYNIEDDLKFGTNYNQFIKQVVDKYNELVFDENRIRNESHNIPELTYDEYEYHLVECCKDDEVLYMRKRKRIITAEANFLRHKAAKFVDQYGAVHAISSVYKTIGNLENQAHRYSMSIDSIRNRRTKEKEKAKKKLQAQAARNGKSFYERQ